MTWLRPAQFIFLWAIALTAAFTAFGGTPAFAVTLDEALQAAVRKNETVAESQQRVVQAEEHVHQARSGVMPNLSLEAFHLIQDQPSDSLARNFSPSRQTQAALTLTQPVFRGFREFAGLRQQKDLLTAEKQSRRLSLVELYRDLAAVYFSILSFEQDLRNLDAQEELSRSRVGEIRSRTRTGESSETEVLTAQSAEASVQAEKEIVRGQLKSAREQFDFLTGLGSDSPLEDPGLLKNDEPEVSLTLSDVLERMSLRPEIKAAEERLKAAGEQVKIMRGAHLPSADLVANYYFLRPEGITSDINWDVRLRLTIPIFEGGLTQSRVREAYSGETVAKLELERLRRAAEQEARSAYEALQSRAKQIKVLKRAKDIAERNYRVLQTDYRRGLTRNLDVQLAQNELRIARRALDQSHFAAQLDLVRLELASARWPEALGEKAGTAP